MAILPDANNCVSTTLVGTNQGATWNNRIHFQGEAALGTVTTSALDTFNNAVATAWGTNVAPLCNPLVILTDVNSIVLTNRTSPVLYSHLTTPVPGTNTGTPLTTAASVCFSWSISRRYRGGHGRIYVPAGNIDDVVNGRTLGATFLASANAAAAAFYAALTGLSLGGVPTRLVVLSYYESAPNPSPPPENISVLRTAGLPFEVTGARVRTRLDTQRRRLGKETV